jgi:hypothetical protein
MEAKLAEVDVAELRRATERVLLEEEPSAKHCDAIAEALGYCPQAVRCFDGLFDGLIRNMADCLRRKPGVEGAGSVLKSLILIAASMGVMIGVELERARHAKSE